MLASFQNDIKLIDTYQDRFFYNRITGNINVKSKENFNTIKDWRIFFALEDKGLYTSELAILLKNEHQYAVINYYNAGQSVATYMNVEIVNNKNELKQLFKTIFIINTVDEVTKKMVPASFDFNDLIDLFPDVKQLTN